MQQLIHNHFVSMQSKLSLSLSLCDGAILAIILTGAIILTVLVVVEVGFNRH